MNSHQRPCAGCREVSQPGLVTGCPEEIGLNQNLKNKRRERGPSSSKEPSEIESSGVRDEAEGYKGSRCLGALEAMLKVGFPLQALSRH